MTPTIGKSWPGRPCAIAFVLAVVTTATVAAQQPKPAKPTPSTTQDPGAQKPSPPSPRDIVFDMGQIVVVGGTERQPGVGGFGRWQVPLMVDGVRIYLLSDNRLDFSRFLTADIAEIQIQKGYASVLDGPGAMGGAINLVTRKPAKAFEAEGSIWTGGREEHRGLERLRDAGDTSAEVLRSSDSDDLCAGR